MIDERLFYFIHGLVTMFFLFAGCQRLYCRDTSRLKRLCGRILLYWAFLELKDLLFYDNLLVRNDYFANLLVLFDMTAVPFCVCFVLEIIDAGWCSVRKAILMQLPFVSAVVLYIFFDSDFIFNALFIYTALFSFVMMVYVHYMIRKHHRLVKDNFSNSDNASVDWLYGVAVMLIICLVFWTFSCYFTSWVVDSCYQLALLVLWIVTIYFVDRQKVLKVHPVVAIKGADSVELLLGAKLEQLMNEDKVWKNPQLTLVDLAALVGTNRTYLSNYLNNTLQTTFYDYINGYRIDAVLRLLHAPDSAFTMAEIAEKCGFNSISTFRRVFHRVKGCSFAEYKKNITGE